MLKHNVKPEKWVGQLQLRFLDTDELFGRTPVLDDIHASVTGNKVKQSVSGGEESSFIKTRRRKCSLRD